MLQKHSQMYIIKDGLEYFCNSMGQLMTNIREYLVVLLYVAKNKLQEKTTFLHHHLDLGDLDPYQ